jgi:hypothetical protein
MMATRTNQSALIKSKIDQLQYRLRELESSAADMRTAIDQLTRMQVVNDAPGISPTFLSPHDPIESRPRLEHRLPVVRRLPPPKPVLPPIIKVVKVKERKANQRPTKFTAEVLASIPHWIEEGLTREQIASRIGTTLGGLQVTCSKKGISLWGKGRSRSRQVEVVFEREQS